MNKAEKFISEHTRKLTQYGVDYFLWITPDNAKEAVKIAREEVIEKACEFLKSYRQETYDGTGYIAGIVNDETIEDFKKYIKGE